MNNLKIIKQPTISNRNQIPRDVIINYDRTTGLNKASYWIIASLLLLWLLLQHFIISNDPSEGFIGPNLWLMTIHAMIAFLVLAILSCWLLTRTWSVIGLPAKGDMVKQFKEMEAWKQLGFFWLSFALLLLSGVLCLTAVI